MNDLMIMVEFADANMIDEDVYYHADDIQHHLGGDLPTNEFKVTVIERNTGLLVYQADMFSNVD